MATPHQETFLPVPEGDIPNRQRNASVTLPQSDLSQLMLNLQLEPFVVDDMAHTRAWLGSHKGGGLGLEGQVHNRRNSGQIVDCSS
ncbi:hypothetical protein DSO57_1019873 [Entomophthora muscae]|uniref:Uncharacterized protein n=1 Tax=Entomophthora muscae TaxID=34485 RepID=A0ACC2T485_9FUNG|nr:hypothetical protein DSO57_1019873 [Entomophthora muscae]